MLAITTPQALADLSAANARGAVATYSSLECTALHFPTSYKLRLMRALNRELSASMGADEVDRGLDRIELDELEDADTAPRHMPYGLER